jgi:hypothetical protein
MTSASAAPATGFEAPPLPPGTVEQEPEDEPYAFEADEDELTDDGEDVFDDESDEECYDEVDEGAVAIDSAFETFDLVVEEPRLQLPTLTNLGIAQRESETDEERAARVHIPSWDDILLGVRRKND